MSIKRLNLMLDSGAFSAWQSGTEVNLNNYITWLKRRSNWLYSYVNLDVPPGGRQNKTPPEAAAASDYNLQKMLDAGLNPIPVFHQYEPWEWLIKMIEDGHPYVGISSRLTLPLRQRAEWLNQVFTLLCNSRGEVCVRTHGFGMGAPNLIFNYPFYTVDSTSWILGGSAYGRVVVPNSASPGKYAQIHVGRANKGLRHISQANMEKEVVAGHLEAAGVTELEVRNSYIARAKLSALQVKQLVATRALEPCKFTQRTTWFTQPKMPPMQPVKPFKLKVFQVAWGNVMNHVLNEIGFNNRLMSYIEIQKWNSEQLANYVTTGFTSTKYKYRGKN